MPKPICAILAVVVGTLLLLGRPAEAAEPSACASSPQLVGQCVTVRGRLLTCAGIPNATIWIVGTKRIVGVADATGNVAGEHLLPGGLEAEMFGSTPCSKAAFGDYTICPLEPDRPGVMRRVCIDRAARIRITEDW